MSNELSKATLERKDKDELTQIAVAMGGKPGSRARKAQIIELIMDLAGVGDQPSGEPGAVQASPSQGRNGSPRGNGAASRGYTADPMADARAEAAGGTSRRSGREEVRSARNDNRGDDTDRDQADRTDRTDTNGHPAGDNRDSGGTDDGGRDDGGTDSGGTDNGGTDSGEGPDKADAPDGPEAGNRKRRRRGRNRDRGDEQDDANGEPIEVEGFLDLRDDGYGFLRVNGALPSKEDVYVSVKQVRQYGLRKGDHLAGAGRPANRSEKNPALVRIDAVNGREPEQAVNRAEFADLTPLFPDERLAFGAETDEQLLRTIDVLAPVGKGSRGLIVAPPRTGRTTVLKELARAIETRHPDVELLVVMVDERPEEVTEMERWLERGSVVATTFDRSAEEHCAAAELSLERAKRRVELEHDIVVILDSITALARAYNTAAGRTASGPHVDPAAIFPAKKFFGAARKAEEGGSLTVLATALAENGSDIDAAILDEFLGTENMTLYLDRRAAERDVFPAVTVDRTATRRAELLIGDEDAAKVVALRHLLDEAAGDEGNVGALRSLLDRLEAAPDNEALLEAAARDAS